MKTINNRIKNMLSLIAIVGAMVMVAQPVLADSPKWGQGKSYPTATLSGDTLTVTFKATGLGTGEYADFSLTGTLDVFSRCYNRGGNKPQADNKQETINVSESGTFPVRGGQTTGSFEVTAESTLTCPGNQIVVIESISYNLTLSGPGGLTATLSN